MESSQGRLMKKKVKPGSIEADAEACALIVNYEVEATVLSDMGEPIVADRKLNQKLIRLKTLNEHTDIPRLAQEIMDKCIMDKKRLIQERDRARVEELLRDLQRHQQVAGAPPPGRRAMPSSSAAEADMRVQPAQVHLDQLPDLIDRCYDGVEAAVEATGHLLTLAAAPENLDALIAHERLLGCLTRLNSDEGKKSTDLAINIMSIVYALSTYSDFHPALLDHKAGSMVMDTVDLEIKRHALRERERAAASGGAPPEDERRERVRVRKQEKLLYVCLHVLLNLAEDWNTERKMCNHGLVPMLTALLGRQNPDLLILVAAFLKKLSIFQENADEMARARLAERLSAFVPNQDEALLEQVLRLLFNLSFHPKCRVQEGKAGMTAKLLSLLRKGRHRLLAVRLLYQLSALDEERPKMTQSVGMLVSTVVNTPDVHLIPGEVLALLVNLMTNADNAKACARSRGALRGLVTLAVRHQHVLALKALRNMALHTGEPHTVEVVRSYAADLLALARQADSPDVQVEAIGLLASLPLEDMEELPDLILQHEALDVLQRLLMPGFAEDDLVLEAVRLTGRIAGHNACVSYVVRSGRILPKLLDTLDEKQEDDEIVLACVVTFYKLLFNDEARDLILTETQLVSHLLDLVCDKNTAVRTHASLALDIVTEHDPTGHWAVQIRARKYQIHNHEWLKGIEEYDVEQHDEAMQINEALSRIHVVHDVSELDGADPASVDGEHLASGNSPESGLGGYDAVYGAEYGLDMQGTLAGGAAACAYGAVSEEMYLSLQVGANGGEMHPDDYRDGEDLEEED